MDPFPCYGTRNRGDFMDISTPPEAVGPSWKHFCGARTHSQRLSNPNDLNKMDINESLRRDRKEVEMGAYQAQVS